MKTIGFIKEKDNKIIREEYLDSAVRLNSELVDERERSKIINYLQNSENVFAITLALFDEEVYIGPYMIFSDGEWFWPNHLPYFFNKAKLPSINIDFLNHVRNKDYQVPSLSADKKKDVITFLQKELLKSN